MAPFTDDQIMAKRRIDAWTTAHGGLEWGPAPAVSFLSGQSLIILEGAFDADTLIEIAMHMKSRK